MYCDLLPNAELCRFCLSDADKTAVSLKNHQILVRVDKKVVDLKDILKFLLLNYSECEELPNLVCNECKGIIVKYYSLKKTFLENEKTLSTKSNSAKQHEKLHSLISLVEDFYGTLKDDESVHAHKDTNRIVIEKIGSEEPIESSSGLLNKPESPDKNVINPSASEIPQDGEINYIEYEDEEFIEEDDVEKVENENYSSPLQAEVLDEHDEQDAIREDAKFEMTDLPKEDSETAKTQESEYEIQYEEHEGEESEVLEVQVPIDNSQVDLKNKAKNKRKHRTVFDDMEKGLIAKKYKLSLVNSNVVVKEDDDTNGFMCSNCALTFTSEKAANDHVQKYGKHQYCTDCRCDECSVIFSSPKLFQKHRSWHILSKISSIFNYHDCLSCKVCFGNEKDYEKHMERHAASENFSYTFEGRPQLDGCEIINQRENSKEEHDSWICGHCGMRFGHKNEINFHLTLFHANLYCPFDRQQYGKSVSYLIDHMKMKHPEQFESEIITFHCSYCFEEFTTKRDVREHEKYCDNKKYECYHCNKKFGLERQLREHLESVNGDMKFSCSFCLKKFNNKSALKVHERIHSKEKPYACTFPGCDKTFRTNSHRSSHMEAHNETKNFKCEYCNSMFQTRAAKRAHEKSHTYSDTCPICQKDFKQRSHFVRHANIVHRIKCGSANLEDEMNKYFEHRGIFKKK